MADATIPSTPGFVDRRNYGSKTVAPVVERRQFTNSHSDLSPRARELAQAIDEYKLHHRRRFITYEEMLAIIEELGYQKSQSVVGSC
ncbi:MAG: hypothetical protein P8N76_07500 [Pirellulaceae bacterium]|nr:hypothetical protein [Pirellulaceae bacterium]